ncbi:hypothetical protein AGMMS49992_24030 [Clostridia bacterium]|nr:hypothetical protein AGMMS49992_24030 [Clostridia bacterium]
MGYSSSVKDENIDAVERLGLSESAIEILHNELSDCFTAPFLSALITDPDFMAMVIYAENSMIFRTHEAEGIDPQCAPIALDASARRYSRMVERMDAESLTANVYDEGEDNIDRIRKNAEKYMLL